MPTKNEVKQIERVFKKPIAEVEYLDIPTYIRVRDIKVAVMKRKREVELERTAYRDSLGMHDNFECPKTKII